MNLFGLINRGIQRSGVHERNDETHINKLLSNERYRKQALDDARAQWIKALVTDETRSWLSISEQDRPVLTGLVAVLTLAGLAKTHDDGNMDSPEVRVIRGAISAATQCAESDDCVISVENAQAFSSAATRARAVFESCTDVAIAHAALQLNNLIHSKEVH